MQETQARSEVLTIGRSEFLRDVVKLNNYCTLYYCSLIYELCLHKHACFFVSTATSWNLSASLKIPLSYQAVYQYLLDNLVSGPSFVPTVIAALHPSNRCEACKVERQMERRKLSSVGCQIFSQGTILPETNANKCQNHSLTNGSYSDTSLSYLGFLKLYKWHQSLLWRCEINIHCHFLQSSNYAQTGICQGWKM